MQSKRQELYYLLGILIINTAFVSIPDKYGSIGIYGFIFHQVKLTGQTYLYMTDVRLVMVLLTYMMWQKTLVYKKLFRLFFYIHVFHTIEFFIHYDSIWFEVNDYKISSRLFTTALFVGRLCNNILYNLKEI